ncbi:MAG: LytTR family transcriptional regulator DNA-binding domain-containing protein [Saprospiraceae bacterium]|nr:LytTR family transcriptional regulator DNA-binding domain-containing protein [Saprospiraceae bacterium]
MAASIKTLIIESRPSSLDLLAKMLNSNGHGVRAIQKRNPSPEDWLTTELVIVEVATSDDLNQLVKAVHRGIKVIAALANPIFLQDVLDLDVDALVAAPYDAVRLLKAIDKIRKSEQSQNLSGRVDSVLHLHQTRKSNSIMIPTSEGFEVIRINELVRIEADRAYCTVYLLNGRHITVSKPLREIEQLLPNDLFFRCHISHVININTVLAYRKEDGGLLVLSDGSKVPVAKARKEELVGMLGV